MFIRLFKSPKLPKKSNNKSLAKNIVKLFSRGNINLQRGNFLTKENIEKRKQKVLSFNLL